MEPTNEHMHPGVGYLPELAPLANPYVPFQIENPPKYHPDFALIRGTTFPGLDLPFHGMANKNPLPKTPMAELQQLSFQIVELAEYLDTHEDDLDALELYQRYQKLYQDETMEYQVKNRQISHMIPSKGGKYGWLKDPWPWEYSANRRD